MWLSAVFCSRTVIWVVLHFGLPPSMQNDPITVLEQKTALKTTSTIMYHNSIVLLIVVFVLFFGRVPLLGRYASRADNHTYYLCINPVTSTAESAHGVSWCAEIGRPTYAFASDMRRSDHP